jgi:NAD(P)H-nitrite reductase large subunit
MTRHVIVGQGVAGVSAAEAIRSVERSAEILMVSNDPNSFYSRPGLAYYLTGELPEKQLYIYSKADWRRLNVKYVKAEALRLPPKEHRLELDRSSALTYDRLLLATGATSALLSVLGEKLKGVMYLDNFDDTRALLKQAHRTKTAVVVGGGVLALELVEGLKSCGVHVHFFLRGDRYWPGLLDEVESRLVENRLEHEGVRIHPNTEVAEILGRSGSVGGVRTKGGETIGCEMVAVAIGARPRTELAQAAGLDVERGILVNETMQTSHPDVFAAGDVGQVYDPMTGKWSIDMLWNPAREQGKAAGLNMAGSSAVYHRTVAVNVLRLGGVMTTIVGAIGSGKDDSPLSFMRGSSETWQKLPNTIAVAKGGGVNQLRLVLGERTLLGALLMGEQTLSLPLQELISRQVDIMPIRAQLLHPDAPLGEVLMDFWLNLSIDRKNYAQN